MKKYCTHCGKQLEEIGEWFKSGYDIDTGKPVMKLALRCPDKKMYDWGEWDGYHTSILVTEEK